MAVQKVCCAPVSAKFPDWQEKYRELLRFSLIIRLRPLRNAIFPAGSKPNFLETKTGNISDGTGNKITDHTET
jgi:hypothetical protein